MARRLSWDCMAFSFGCVNDTGQAECRSVFCYCDSRSWRALIRCVVASGPGRLEPIRAAQNYATRWLTSTCGNSHAWPQPSWLGNPSAWEGDFNGKSPNQQEIRQPGGPAYWSAHPQSP